MRTNGDIMTRYWLCIINEDNYKIVKQEKTLGVNEQYSLALRKFKKGDMVVFYVKRRKLGGAFQVDSNMYEDRENIIFSGGDFPYRIKLKIVKLPKSGMIEWDDEMIRRVQFFRNKEKWMLHLLGRAFCEISIGDYGYLYSRIT